jgi:hypothetical protein
VRIVMAFPVGLSADVLPSAAGEDTRSDGVQTPRDRQRIVPVRSTVLPWNSPSGVSRQQNADIRAFMHKHVNCPVGTTVFPADAEAQDRLSIAAGK